MIHMLKHHTRRYAIAFALMSDIADVSAYQPGRQGKVPLYQAESFAPMGMAVALRAGERLPERDSYEWTLLEKDVYGYDVYVA